MEILADDLLENNSEKQRETNMGNEQNNQSNSNLKLNKEEFLRCNKINVNDCIDGRPPIHYAADYGQTEVVRYLAEKGADVNAKDKHGISALLAAIWEGHTECVRFMLEKGASKKGTTPDGMTYIEAAEKQEIKELLK